MSTRDEDGYLAPEREAHDPSKPLVIGSATASYSLEPEATDPMVEWLTGCLDAMEGVAKFAINDTRSDEWATLPDPDDLIVRIGASKIDETVLGYGSAAHIALHDPRAVLARVEAERAVLMEHGPDDGFLGPESVFCAGCQEIAYDRGSASDGPTWPCPTLRLLAYGHRFDYPGYRDEWKPEGMG